MSTAPHGPFAAFSLDEARAVGAIDSCPNAGGGVHGWILRSTMILAASGLKNEAILRLILHLSADCGRTVADSEILDAIDGARRQLALPPEKRPAVRAVKAIPVGERERLALWDRIRRESPVRSLADLHARSDPIPATAEGILEGLLGTESLVVVKPRHRHSGVAIRLGSAEARTLESYPLFIPARAIGVTAYRESDGKISASIKENFATREFLLVEMDSAPGDWDLQAAVLGHVAKTLCLRLVTYSGKKSMHGVFELQGCAHREYLKLLQRAATLLGIDAAPLSNRVNASRMPWSLRPETGQVQRPHFFASAPTLFK